MDKVTLPNSCIECKEADCTGYCKILKDRQEDYALARHKECPLEGEDNGEEKIYHTNKKQDAACKYLHGRIKLVLPYIYSAIALALWNVLDESDEEKERDIATLINESQIIWNQCVEEGKNIVDWCEEVTGFDIRNSLS